MTFSGRASGDEYESSIVENGANALQRGKMIDVGEAFRRDPFEGYNDMASFRSR